MHRGGSSATISEFLTACMPRRTHAHNSARRWHCCIERIRPARSAVVHVRSHASKQQPLTVRWLQGGRGRQKDHSLDCSFSADPAVPAEPAIQSTVPAPSVTVRQAEREDYWAVAEVHCRSFYPRAGCIMGPLLRLDRVKAIEMGHEKAEITGLGRFTCLVACEDPSDTADASERVETAGSRHKLPAFFRALVSRPLKAGFGRDPGRYGVVGTIIVDSMGEHVPMRKVGNRLERREGMAYISNLSVEPSHRRKGIGLQLLWKAAKIAKDWGCHAIVLQIDRQNAGARELYVQAGYRRVAEEPAFLPWIEGRPQSRLELMVKLLGKRP